MPEEVTAPDVDAVVLNILLQHRRQELTGLQVQAILDKKLPKELHQVAFRKLLGRLLEM